ncbi:hypothetical protein KGF54_000422 [Candida jiufengensis]|uniref:uncharacterized protein n=1 Tax=Candida jiufengensis TaxID=497108 RepID=UPI002224E36B|nr:uncharacterized protein KGF54_000422 [Candida jiufengensis]KAI5956805.1 hypothetical protein KGF54_000422 [Candida jiufengensis]
MVNNSNIDKSIPLRDQIPELLDEFYNDEVTKPEESHQKSPPDYLPPYESIVNQDFDNQEFNNQILTDETCYLVNNNTFKDEKDLENGKIIQKNNVQRTPTDHSISYKDIEVWIPLIMFFAIGMIILGIILPGFT